MTAVDLGCSPGKSTELLLQRFPNATVTGLDSSPGCNDCRTMRTCCLASRPSWRRAGGSLAVQMPDNLDEPAHQLMREVATDGPWAAKLARAAGAREAMRTPGWYYGVLRPHCARVDVWRTTYHHPLPDGANAVVEWFKGSGLRPFLAPLNPIETKSFSVEYRKRIADAYPASLDGSVLLPFPRLFGPVTAKLCDLAIWVTCSV